MTTNMYMCLCVSNKELQVKIIIRFQNNDITQFLVIEELLLQYRGSNIFRSKVYFFLNSYVRRSEIIPLCQLNNILLQKNI